MGVVFQSSSLLIISSLIAMLDFLFVHSYYIFPSHIDLTIERDLVRWSKYMALRTDQYNVYAAKFPHHSLGKL